MLILVEMGMTDRELIELAATAAGMMLTDNGVRDLDANGTQHRWNPLTDDGDALRLLVEISSRSVSLEMNAGVCLTIGHPSIEADEWPPADAPRSKNEMLRRAIVRAAAEVGKAMATNVGAKR